MSSAFLDEVYRIACKPNYNKPAIWWKIGWTVGQPKHSIIALVYYQSLSMKTSGDRHCECMYGPRACFWLWHHTSSVCLFKLPLKVLKDRWRWFEKSVCLGKQPGVVFAHCIMLKFPIMLSALSQTKRKQIFNIFLDNYFIFISSSMCYGMLSHDPLSMVCK